MRSATEVLVTKMHGAENVFALLDERPPRFERYDDLARRLCEPGGPLGGTDGLLVVLPALGAAADLRIFNADGSEAEMCGNGVRCVARYLTERGAGDAFTILTLAGPIGVTVDARAPFRVTVDIGPVRFPREAVAETFEALGRAWRFYDVSLGNPHAVLFVDDVVAVDLAALGTAAQGLARFPHGTNVHVVAREAADAIAVRHYERGVGLTQACGTGAVASAAATIVVCEGQSPMHVRVPGGLLDVRWQPGERARLTGGAETLMERTLAL